MAKRPAASSTRAKVKVSPESGSTAPSVPTTLPIGLVSATVAPDSVTAVGAVFGGGSSGGVPLIIWLKRKRHPSVEFEVFDIDDEVGGVGSGQSVSVAFGGDGVVGRGAGKDDGVGAGVAVDAVLAGAGDEGVIAGAADKEVGFLGSGQGLAAVAGKLDDALLVARSAAIAEPGVSGGVVVEQEFSARIGVAEGAEQAPGAVFAGRRDVAELHEGPVAHLCPGVPELGIEVGHLGAAHEAGQEIGQRGEILRREAGDGEALLDMLATLIGDEVEAIGVGHGLDGSPFRLDLRDRLVIGWIHQPGREPGGGVDIRVVDGIDQFSPKSRVRDRRAAEIGRHRNRIEDRGG